MMIESFSCGLRSVEIQAVVGCYRIHALVALNDATDLIEIRLHILQPPRVASILFPHRAFNQMQICYLWGSEHSPDADNYLTEERETRYMRCPEI